MNNVDAISIAATLFVKSSVILIVAWAVAYALRRRSAALRHVLWTIALAAMLAVPMMAAWMPPLEIDASGLLRVMGPTPTGVPADVPASVQIAPAAPSGDIGAPSPSAEPTSSEESGTGLNGQIAFILLIAWMCGTGLLLLLSGVHLVRIWTTTAAAVPNQRILRLAAEAANRFQLAQPPRVLVGSVDSPVVWGLLRPAVLLPDASTEWTEERLRAALMHEFAHIRRRDYAAHILGELACAIYWPNPLVWVARYQLQIEQERACDDAVLRDGIPSHEYAEHLLHITRSLQGPSLRPVGLRMARTSGLKDRIRTILDPRIERSAVSIRGLLLVSLAIALPAVSAAALRAADGAAERSSDAKGPVDSTIQHNRDDEALDSTPAVPGTEERRIVALTLEAEVAHLRPPMAVHVDRTASGGKYVMVADGDGNDPPEGGPGRAAFRVDLDYEGQYWIWARVIGDRSNDNSFFVSIDDGVEVRWDILDSGGENVADWTWLPVTTDNGVRMESGGHDLTFRNREDGSRLDAVFITTDPNLIPMGRSPMPPSESPFSVAFEAEDSHEFSAPLEVRTDEDASSRLYIAGAPGSKSLDAVPESGRAAYQVALPRGGRYAVWGRVLAADAGKNSFWIRANNGAWVRWNGIQVDEGWRWRLVHDADDGNEIVRFPLHAGTNTIEIAYREGGTRIDRFLVTNDPYSQPDDRRRHRSNVTVILKP